MIEGEIDFPSSLALWRTLRQEKKNNATLTKVSDQGCVLFLFEIMAPGNIGIPGTGQL